MNRSKDCESNIELSILEVRQQISDDADGINHCHESDYKETKDIEVEVSENLNKDHVEPDERVEYQNA